MRPRSGSHSALLEIDDRELMLGISGRDQDESTHRLLTRVPDGVNRATRNEHETSGRDAMLAISEEKRRLAARDVERLVGVRVEVNRRSRLTRWEAPISATYAPCSSSGPKRAIGPSVGLRTVHPLIVSIWAP
jgi:hypothetical protein